ARRLAGADPVSGTDAIPLSAGARTLLDFLRAPMPAAPTSMAPGPTLATTILDSLAHAPPTELPLVLTALHRTPDAEYGNGLFRLAATVQRTGTAQQYLAFVRLLHQPGMEVALDEADPRLGVQAEREAALNRSGQPSALTDEQMAGLFSARALELAYTLLRDSERQLLRVLTQSQGESATTGPDLDADAGRAIEVLNRLFDPDLPAFVAFETWAERVRQAAAAQGATVADAQLRRVYNRQRQILLYRAGAVRLRLLRTSLRQVREEISEHEDWFRTMSNRPLEYNLIGGYAPAMMYRQQEGERRNGELRRLRPREQAMSAGQREVESALPLLGGLDDAGLQRIAELQGGEAEFDQLLATTLNTIFANIVQARRLLHSGEVSVYLLDPVVAATRNALGIGDPPANDTQRRWAAVIAAQRAQAVEHRDQVRHVLEIINTGALIAALGLAVFTGGGSLALYAGLAVGGIGLAGGLAASAYDVADARRRTREAETLYGSGLTAETRISDVPADYRFLHFAWIGLGVNVVLSAFMLRGLGTQFAAALRGSEDAVRAQARILVARLRAAGATQSEEERLESTMAALRERGWVAGAVRGGSVYEVHPTRVEWLTGAGRSLEREVDTLATQPRLGGATLTRATPGTGPGAPSVYRMQVPGPGGTTVTADITFEARTAAALPPGAHGTESGPARLVLTPNGTGGWTANVYVHQGLRPGAFSFVMGHELDEIAAIIRRLPATATADQIAAQMRPGIFRPGSVGPMLTAHDEAAVAELRRLLEEAADPRFATGPARVFRQQRLEAMYESMGLRDPTNIVTRTTALRPLLPAGMLDVQQLEREAISAGVLARFRATPAIGRTAALSRDGSLIIDEDVVEHLIYPRPRSSLPQFRQMGVAGGHLDSELRALERANPNYAFLEDAAVSPRPAAGTRFHRYRQFQWDPTAGGAPNAPTAAALRPGGASFNAAHWVESIQTKTTVDNIQTMLIEAEDAFTQWRTTNPGLATTQDQWGRGLTPAGASGSLPPAVSANGVEFSGRVTYTPASGAAPATWRWRTAFVEASWF
ncbi:MAG TPA: hypothetical protein VFH27_06115, partial [Longimicrobiaceae bacterium]|nr:hypothetical protein [Longimicrobiaceae bacterium]